MPLMSIKIREIFTNVNDLHDLCMKQEIIIDAIIFIQEAKIVIKMISFA